MKIKASILFVSLLLSVSKLYGNINYIDFNKIENHEKYESYFSFIKNNVEYYDHWAPEWKYDKNKNELILKLKDAYLTFSSIPRKDVELYLLKGEIAHYLYNLDVASYFDSAVNNFTEAIKINPQDFRATWFLANHYALGNEQEKSIDFFFKAQDMRPLVKPGDFWEEYAFAMAVAQMPSHTMFAIDKIRSVTGKESYFEANVWPAIYSQMKTLEKDSSYKKEEIWNAVNGEMATFFSRPLGIKLLVDTSWNLTIYDYSNHQGAFIIDPPSLRSKKSAEIGYTIAIMMSVADSDQKLENYIDKFGKKYSDKKRITTFNKYDKMIAYEIHDKTMYANAGGGHMVMIAIERDMPKYPGLLIENPVTLDKDQEKGKVSYYTASNFKNRFKSKIFYLLLLDTCEDIYSQSFSIFKTLFDKQIIIE